jgi:Zn-dependent peptidase ImmA (M78 family)
MSTLQNEVLAAAVAHFTTVRSFAWSAALVPLGSVRLIIENDLHARVRRRSSIAHEMGHHLLEHDFSVVILGEDHQRQFDENQEKQATFMAGELLVPFEAVERMAFDGWDNSRVAQTYQVSEQFAQMTMYGQRIRAQRSAARFPSRG